jgi:hypothetical protein
VIENIIVAIVIAALVGLLLVGLLGPILNSVGIPIVAVLGAFFVRWGWVLGVLIGLLWFFGGGPIFGFGGKH